MSHSSHCRRGNFLIAFTLVELLVVIGIIAVLVGILLPVLGRVQQRARTVACQSNLRQLAQAAIAYTAENKGSFPYGFYWNRTNPATGFTSDGGASGFVAWFTVIGKYLKSQNGDNSQPAAGFNFSTLDRTLSGVFRCPEAPGLFQQQVHYYQHPVIMPHLPLEIRNTPAGQVVIRPAMASDVFADNALFWDTPLLNSMSSRQPLPFFNISTEGGTTLPASFIDEGQLRSPQYPELRYRDHIDRFAGTALSEGLRIDESIIVLTDEIAQSFGYPGYNNDMGAGTFQGRQIGSVRWRHNSNTTANVAFADGSVRPLQLNKNRVREWDGYETDFKRRMLMIKWATGKRPSGTYGTAE